MGMDDIARRGLVLFGCGHMGSAMLKGWLAQGLAPQAITVIDRSPSAWLQAQGLRLNGALPEDPAAVVIAVKPQGMFESLSVIARYGAAEGAGRSLVITVAAGIPLAAYERALGAETPLVRAMPNMPSSIGRGVTAIIGNAATDAAGLGMAEALLAAVGAVVRLEDESQMDAVTAVSGSGPAYVFHLIDTLAAAGEAEGLSRDLALQLALGTVAGAGELAQRADESPAELRTGVASPGGTTEAALRVLMDDDGGLGSLMKRAVAAAARRSRELADG